MAVCPAPCTYLVLGSVLDCVGFYHMFSLPPRPDAVWLLKLSHSVTISVTWLVAPRVCGDWVLCFFTVLWGIRLVEL